LVVAVQAADALSSRLGHDKRREVDPCPTHKIHGAFRAGSLVAR
jgi:hypothetical protein